jgi:hypothetical protein
MILRHDYSDSIVQKTTTPPTFFIGQIWRNIMKADKKRKKDGEEKNIEKFDRKRETERKG